MPREVITVHVGQCGNQLGTRFWRSHSASTLRCPRSSSSSSSSSRVVVAARASSQRTMMRYPPSFATWTGRPPARRGSPIDTLRARGDGGHGGGPRDGGAPRAARRRAGPQAAAHRCSGSGNNWACGHDFYGNKYADDLLELLRTAAEDADSLQGFFMTHSMGGGTAAALAPLRSSARTRTRRSSSWRPRCFPRG